MRGQLDRILASAAFADAERTSSFLRYIVERAVEGCTGEIKESVIAVEVLGRSPHLIRNPIRSSASRLDACARASLLITNAKAKRIVF